MELKPNLTFMDITGEWMIKALGKFVKLNSKPKLHHVCSAMGQQSMVIEAIQARQEISLLNPSRLDRVVEAITRR